MLSGSLSGWAGWAVSGPLTWAGWLVAGALLCCQPGRRRWAGVVVVSLSSGFAVYEGMPESLLFIGIAVGTIVLVCGVMAMARGKLDLRARSACWAGVAGGVALSAPLWLPGLAVLRQSSRAAENGTGGLPAHALALLLAQGYDGLPTKGSSWFGPADYYEATGYIGVVAIVLALVAVLVAWRRPIVAALTATVLVSLGIIYVPATQRLFTRLGAGSIATQRMLPMLAFAVAMLAGLGTDIVQRRWREPVVQLKALASVVACGAVLAFLLASASAKGLSPVELSVRRHSLFWPALTLLAMGLLAMGCLVMPLAWLATGGLPVLAPRASMRRRERTLTPTGATFWTASGACLLMLAAQSAYLVWAGVGVNSFAARPFPVTPAVAKLQQLVGHNLLALDGTNKHDVTLWSGVGIYPEVNIGYGLRELAVHDPVIPPGLLPDMALASGHAQGRLGEQLFRPRRRVGHPGPVLRRRLYPGLSWQRPQGHTVRDQVERAASGFAFPLPGAGGTAVHVRWRN